MMYSLLHMIIIRVLCRRRSWWSLRVLCVRTGNIFTLPRRLSMIIMGILIRSKIISNRRRLCRELILTQHLFVQMYKIELKHSPTLTQKNQILFKSTSLAVNFIFLQKLSRLLTMLMLFAMFWQIKFKEKDCSWEESKVKTHSMEILAKKSKNNNMNTPNKTLSPSHKNIMGYISMAMRRSTLLPHNLNPNDPN